MSTLIAVSGLGIMCLLLEILNLRKLLIPVVLLLLATIMVMTVAEFNADRSFFEADNFGMVVATSYSRTFSILFIVLAMAIIAMCPTFYKEDKVKIADYVAIKVFLLAGAIAMVSFGNLAMFFLGLEVLSISVYVLAASRPRDLKSNEAGMKYFIMGAFASSFILFGIALIYGAVGSFNISVIASYGGAQTSMWFMLGMFMVSTGLFFKASIVPFHFWAPDVYQGSPTLVTAMMSTLVRVAAIGAMYKVITLLSGGITPAYQIMLIVLSILTMTVGNVTALRQYNLKRMMAYSGISHTGFMMMTLLALSTSASTLLYYAAAYSLAGIAAFAVILSVCKDKENEDISLFYGLARKKPALAVILTCALLSMGGMPIFSGFFAKFFVFDQMLKTDHLILVVFGIINAVIAIFYYVRVVTVMFARPSESKDPIDAPFPYVLVGGIAVMLTLLLGIMPSFIMGLKL